MKPIIKINNLTIQRDLKNILEINNLSISSNTVILGPNGAGKTTFLRLLLRDIYPLPREDTRVEILGKNRWNIWELRKYLGIVSHQLQGNIDPFATGFNVVLSGYFSSNGFYGIEKASEEQANHSKEILKSLELDYISNRAFHTLSTGEQRRTLLGRALVHEPDVLILDEPSSGMDLKAFVKYSNIIRNLMSVGKIIILVTHNINEIPPEIDNIILLNNGRITDTGVKVEMLTSEKMSGRYGIDVNVVEQN